MNMIEAEGQNSTALWEKMEDMIIKTFVMFNDKSKRKEVQDMEHTEGTTLFGFDFIIDENFRPYMIELNRNPEGKGSNVLNQWINIRQKADWFTMLGLKLLDAEEDYDDEKTIILNHLEREARSRDLKLVFPRPENVNRFYPMCRNLQDRDHLLWDFYK